MGQQEVRGLKELALNLSKLPEMMRKKILRKADYKASKVVIAAIRESIPQSGITPRTGTLEKRIGSKVITRKMTNQMVLIVGPLILKGGSKELRELKRQRAGIDRDPFYSRYLEFGTKTITARQYTAKAFYASKEAYIQALQRELQATLEIEVQKAFGLKRKSR